LLPALPHASGLRKHPGLGCWAALLLGAPEYKQKRHGNSTGPLAPTGTGRAQAANQAGKEKKCETGRPAKGRAG